MIWKFTYIHENRSSKICILSLAYSRWISRLPNSWPKNYVWEYIGVGPCFSWGFFIICSACDKSWHLNLCEEFSRNVRKEINVQISSSKIEQTERVRVCVFYMRDEYNIAGYHHIYIYYSLKILQIYAIVNFRVLLSSSVGGSHFPKENQSYII